MMPTHASLAMEAYMASALATRVPKAAPRTQLFNGGRIDLDAVNAHQTLQTLMPGTWACSFRPGESARLRTVASFRRRGINLELPAKPPVNSSYTKVEFRPNRSRKWG